MGIPPTNGYPEVLVSSEQIAKSVFVGADSSGTGLDMLRAQLLGAKLNALLFPGFADAFLPSGERVSDVILHADQILNDEANGIHHDKSEITAVKDLLDAANNNSHVRILRTCPPAATPTPTASATTSPTATPTGTPTSTPTATPTPTASPSPTPSPTPGPCQPFSGGLTMGYWKTHTGLDSPARDSTYDSLPIFLGIAPDNGQPELLVATEQDARDVLTNANSSGYGYTMLRAQLLTAKLNAIKFPGFANASLLSGEVVNDMMNNASRLLDDAANGISHTKAEIVLISDLLDRANNNESSAELQSCGRTAAPAASTTDFDGDGFSDELEGLHLGTNASKACGANGWPLDLVQGGAQPNTLNLQDMASFVAPVRHLGAGPGDAGFDPRWDLVPGSVTGKWINLQDIAAMVAGPTAYPTMFGGQRAFGKACVTSPDGDNDRVANAYDNCPLIPNSGQANWDGDPRGDACDDDEGDGFVDSVEFHVGTDPVERCSQGGWAANLNDTVSSKNKINLQDLASYVSPIRHLNSSPGDASFDVRWDISPGNGGLGKTINLLDLAVIVTLKPPMFGGQRAFNGPTCSP